MTTPSLSSWSAPIEARRSLETSAARALVERLFQHHPTKRFAVRLWDGSEVAWGAQRDFTLVFRDLRAFISLMASHDASELAAAYVDGRLGIEGDVDAAVGLGTFFRTEHDGVLSFIARPVKRAIARLRSVADDADDVQAHYDLSDEFFRLFLDQRMVYSCAYFAHPGQSLEDAQERKLDLVCRKLQLRQGDAFLDVGCGWGALVMWAAERYGAVAHGITLSRNQAETARAAAAQKGLSDRVTIEELHYKDLPEAAFDKIASVGMIEHVGTANYGAYFAKLERALRPGGLLLNHGITRRFGPSRGDGGTFIQRRVFPGAELDVVSHTQAVMEEQGLEIVDVQSLRPHYALTLREWGRRYTAHRDQASRLVPERVLRAWDLIFQASVADSKRGSCRSTRCSPRSPRAMERGRRRSPARR